MEKWAGKVAIVTGAGAGIGAAIAERLVKEGLKVVGIDCRKDRLDALAGTLSDANGKLYSIQADLSIENDVLKAFEWIKKNVGPIHILINNAGMFKSLRFLNMNAADAKALLDLNVVTLMITVRETLKIFQENGISGYIININSLSGHYVVDWPGFGVYTASKFAVTALTEALYMEVDRLKLGTKVTSISPSLVKTELVRESFIQRLNKYYFFVQLNANDIADATVYVLSTPPDWQIDEVIISAISTNE